MFMNKINKLAIFCGSKTGNNGLYQQHALELATIMAEHKIELVYGGGRKGIMGIVADTVMMNGGIVKGVIPQVLVDWEHQHEGITDLSVVDDMHIRKQKMYDLCDAAVILPGGVGTLDEFFEMVTWNQLSIHDKKIYIINSDNFFDFLLKHIQQMEKQGFLYESVLERITVLDEPEQLLQYLN